MHLASETTPSDAADSADITGTGDLQANIDTAGKLAYTFGDRWVATVTMDYTLGGEAKTLTATITAEPEFGYVSFLYSTTATGAVTSKTVTLNTEIWVRLNDPLTYSVDFTSLKLVWMKEVSPGTYAEAGAEQVLWDGSGASPVTVTGPEEKWGEWYYLYTYETTLDITPPGGIDADCIQIVPAYTACATDPYDGTVYPITDVYPGDPVKIDE